MPQILKILNELEENTILVSSFRTAAPVHTESEQYLFGFAIDAGRNSVYKFAWMQHLQIEQLLAN